VIARALGGAILLTLLVALLAPFNTAAVSPPPPCLLIVATPPPGAQLGLDCMWHLPDGSVIPVFPGQKASTQASVNDKDIPWQILLPGAFIIPIAVLLGFSFFVRRRGGGH
jgi:hypothetical protein